jgi:sugar phosphate isomerase/epimerase
VNRIALFPKFLASLSPEALADEALRAGVDTVKMVVRDGFWVRTELVAQEAPRFIAAMAGRGVRVEHATTMWPAAEVAADPERLRVLAANGIRTVRIGHFPLAADPRSALRRAREELARVAEAAGRAGIQVIYQLHHRALVSSASAATALVEGLDPRHLALQLDPGNQRCEGWEDFAYQLDLLGPHVGAVAVKDLRWLRDETRAGDPDKGWYTAFCALDEGIIDWHAIARELTARGFAGHLVLMPFYHERDPSLLLATLARDARWLRQAFSAAPSSIGASA